MRAVILLLALAATAQAQWTIQTPTTADLRGIDNVGKGIAWASGTNGTVLRTEDAGYLWQRCTIPPNAEHLDFRGIQAFDANTAIVMSSGPGDQSRLYKTTDGCQTWTLLFTNPDKEGFWDAIVFDRRVPTNHSWRSHQRGVLIGDPVDGKFVIYQTSNSGDNWFRWGKDKVEYPAIAEVGEAIFAASNSSAISPGINGPFAFVTGGSGGPRLFVPEPHSPFDNGTTWKFRSNHLPFPKGDGSGAFSIAVRRDQDGGMHPDLMVVGGDYMKPDELGTSAFIPWRSPFESMVSPSIKESTTPPRGYRSAVAYDAPTKTWITVGPNGTDISTDDGRNWRPLHPTNNDAPDADQHWNALSLPYAVGPHGRIGILNPSALQPTPTK
jgi:hypothetical protein